MDTTKYAVRSAAAARPSSAGDAFLKVGNKSDKIEGVRRRAEIYYEQFDVLRSLRQHVRRELLAESAKHKASELLCQIPSIGPILAVQLIAILETP
jgi:hypothetical protein